MSAGEQKVFYILEKIFRAKKYSLILIDELDLLLHDQAMKKLVDVVLERSNDKNLQVVFTTHRESILDLEDRINIRHIVCRPHKTLCFNETKPDAINRLTGVQPKPIEVFVEDDVAAAIVRKVAANLKLIKYTSVSRYGAATNCFTTVGGLLLGGEPCDNSLFVLDGDVYRTHPEKVTAVDRVLTGHDNNVLQAKTKAISIIKQFTLPDGAQPEKYLHSLLINIGETENEEFNEIIEVASEIIAVDNEHKFISDIIERLGWERATGLSKIIDLASTSDDWSGYVNEVYEWLSAKKDNMREELAAA